MFGERSLPSFLILRWQAGFQGEDYALLFDFTLGSWFPGDRQAPHPKPAPIATGVSLKDAPMHVTPGGFTKVVSPRNLAWAPVASIWLESELEFQQRSTGPGIWHLCLKSGGIATSPVKRETCRNLKISKS